MKSFLRLCRTLLPHIVIDLSVVFMVFLVLNRYNPMMGFLNNAYSRPLLWILCILSFLQSLLLAAHNRREP